jgi:hypothetical protein
VPREALFAHVVFAAVDMAAAGLSAEVPGDARIVPVVRAVDARAEFLAAAVRAAEAVVFGVELRAAVAPVGRSSFNAGSATTSTVAAALSAADFDGVRAAALFFAGVFRAGVFFAVEGAASAT